MNNIRYADDTTIMAESKNELKSQLLDERAGLKSEKTGLTFKKQTYGIWSHHFMGNRWGNSGNSDRLFSWASKSPQMVTAAMKLKDACPLEEKL